MSASTQEKPQRRTLLWTAAGIGIVLLLIWFVSGSRSRVRDATPKSQTAGAEAETELLRRQLEATLDGLRPERLNVSADTRGLVDDLNLWWADYAATVSLPYAEQQSAEIAEWLGPEAGARAAALRFDARDAAHIRNALMYRAIAASIAAEKTSDAERAQKAFDLAVSQIALLPSTSQPAPAGSFELLLLGRGTAQDRMWIFAEILRQLGLDCVVLQPREQPDAENGPYPLVGVIVPGEGVYLFDPVMGLPICPPGDQSEVLPSRAVTLAEARSNDAVFRQFDVPDGAKYPWSAERLADVDVRFVIDSTYGAPRMLALQAALPSEFAATLFDGPAVAEGEPSLKERVIAAGADAGWTPETVDIWKYPDEQMSSYYAAGGESSTDMQQRLATLSGPRILRKKIVEGMEVLVEDVSSNPLRVVRVQHLRGDVQAALNGYGVIRSAKQELSGNVEVREDAVYWVAFCQFELGRYDTAASTLSLSLRDYPAGVWAAPARKLLACCAAHRGEFAEAVETLREAGPTTDFRDAFLERRWLALAETSAEPSPSVSAQ